MKIIKTTLGWEIQPQSNDERYHLNWFVDYLKSMAEELSSADLFVSSQQVRGAIKSMGHARREAMLGTGFYFTKPTGDDK